MNPERLKEGERKVHKEISELANVSRRDSELNYYFASVLEEVLEAVSKIEQDAEHSSNRREAKIVEGFERGLDQVTQVIDEGLSTKRTVDLLTACNDLDERHRGWQRDISPNQILSFVDQDSGAQRGEVSDKLKELNSVNFLNVFNEPEPAESVCESVRVWVRDTGADFDDGDYCPDAVNFLGLVLLQSVEDLMDEDKQPYANRRLQQSVY
ncbi:hypothetical protein [Candidatus Nanohalobium constans]|uniref:Uncharacterized protein n=1 Tax=Candidatus Nanohalobium constans TaxID=2565781 RepID=A0A5Q0UEI7_9ARCH|nr:hypothetical protein [Candidatus Nanohalobium constans]QGA79947.1 hypothetical protein LC1Nh_0039 [Candidatus Nanohalobium constans]